MSAPPSSRLRQSLGYLRGALWNTIAPPPAPDDADLDRHLDELKDRYAVLRGQFDSEPEVSVVFPVHVIEPRDTFLKAMTSLLLAADAPPTEVIVVLNGVVPISELVDSELHRICDRIGVRIVTRSFSAEELVSESGGPMAHFLARQPGLEAARGSIVLFADIDCVFSERWIRAYVDAFDADPELLAAYGPPQNYGAAGPVGRLMIVTSTIVKASKILLDFAPYAGHNHALRRELCDRIPDLYGRIERNNNDLPGIIARDLPVHRDITGFTRCVADAQISTYFPSQTESPRQALGWLVRTSRRNLKDFGRLWRNKRISASRAPAEKTASAEPRLGYVMSRFPKISETFVLREILELKRLGVAVEIYPLLRRQQSIMHGEAEELAAGAHYHPFLSADVVRANLHFLRTRPRAYFGTMWEVLRGTIRSLRHFPRTLAVLPKSVYLAREMERAGVTHVHAHFSNHPALVALIVHRLTGIPYSFTAHGSDLHIDQSFLAAKVRAAAFVVTISDYNKQFMLEVCGDELREKIQVIRCGVDPAVFTPEPRAPEDRPYRLLCVGSLGPVKGYRYLIEACEILRDRGVSFDCHILGEGELRRDIESQISRAGLSDRVTLHGAVRQDGVVRWMRHADVMVLPSVQTPRGDREGIPVVLMEAMAAGLPVVSSRLSGIPELVIEKETGVLVEPRDSTGIADALHALSLDAETRRRMGAAGRERVLERFNLETNVRKLAERFRASHRDRVSS